jgi:hypothetical protein
MDLNLHIVDFREIAAIANACSAGTAGLSRIIAAISPVVIAEAM